MKKFVKITLINLASAVIGGLIGIAIGLAAYVLFSVSFKVLMIVVGIASYVANLILGPVLLDKYFLSRREP